MIIAPDIQAMVQKHMFASMPASVRAEYEAANRRFSQSIKSAEDPGKDNPEVAEHRKKRAAVVVSAKTVSPEQARANIIAAYEKQHREGVDGLSSAIEREREARYGKVAPRVTAVDQLAIALEDARVAA